MHSTSHARRNLQIQDSKGDIHNARRTSLDSMDEDAPKNRDQAMCKNKASRFDERGEFV
jgi:hypothetical protein